MLYTRLLLVEIDSHLKDLGLLRVSQRNSPNLNQDKINEEADISWYILAYYLNINCSVSTFSLKLI